MAALTTSLPETPGGERNWDYRYTWMRDSTFTLQALHWLNLDWEADEFMQFVADIEPNSDGALQIMYGIDGRRDLTETTRDDLSGYAGARPVRVGNALPLSVIAGPCQMESRAHALETASALREFGHTVMEASGGPAALDLLNKPGFRIDLLVVDFAMPGMNGVELDREIRRLHRGLPVILTSGYSHVLAEDASHGFELLRKPYSVKDLSRALRKAMHH